MLSKFNQLSLHYPDLSSGPLAKAPQKTNDRHNNSPLIVLPTNNTVVILKVEKGDSLSTLFNKAGLPISLMYKVLDSSADAKRLLTQLIINQQVTFTLDEAGDLLSIVTKPKMLNTYSITKQGENFQFLHNNFTPTY